MSNSKPLREVRICLVGKTGVGKSTLGNLLCPGANFKTSAGAASVTFTSQQARTEYPERGLVLVLLDTMGLGDTVHGQLVVRQKITEGIKSLVGGVDLFFLCIKKERFTDENHAVITHLYDVVLGSQALENTWLVVTHAEDLAGDAKAQAEWLRDARDNQQKLSEVLRLVGAHKVLFVESRASEDPRLDAIYAEGRQSSCDLLLSVAKANSPARFDVKHAEAAQKAHDDRVAAAEAQRKAEEARVERERAEAAAAQKAALAKAQADAAAKEAALQAQIASEKARAEKERQEALKREDDLRRQTAPVYVVHHGGGSRGCVLC